VIRRGFWLALGAAGGIMGYRRAVRLGRRAASGALGRDAIRATRQARRFTRDVREGMDLYSARHPSGEAPRLPVPPEGTARRASRGRARPATDRTGRASTRGASGHRVFTSNDATAKDDHDAVG
jgi:hypothetical protein